MGYKYSLSKQFKTVDDLLGANYALDIDKFAERDFLTTPSYRTTSNAPIGVCRAIYLVTTTSPLHNINFWLQQEHKYRHFDIYYGAKLAYNLVQREGLMKNGRYPDTSLGKGKQHHMVNFEAKAGATYKINGRHFVTANFSYHNRPPLVREMYISPDITGLTAPTLNAVQIFNTDLNYIFSTPQWKGRVGYFVTNFWDDMRKVSYYNDEERTFVHHTLYGINKLHHGIEVGIEYRPTQALTFDLIGTIAQYYYTNNPMGVQNSTNGNIKNQQERVYLQNLYLPAVCPKW